MSELPPRPPVPGTPRRTHYEVLGISRDASEEDIKKAYRKLARTSHPDMASGDAEKFKALNEAHTVLVDPTKRSAYNKRTFGSNDPGQLVPSVESMMDLARAKPRPEVYAQPKISNEQVQREIENHLKRGCARIHTRAEWATPSQLSKQKEVEGLVRTYRQECDAAGLTPDEDLIQRTLQNEGLLSR